VTAQKLYALWAAVGPLIGVVIGAWLTARWQRRRWIQDNKTAEYRGAFDALNTYRWRLLNHLAQNNPFLSAGDPRAMAEERIALADAQVALSNILADRLFIRQAVSSGGLREDYERFSRSLLSSDPPNISEASRTLAGLHRELVQMAEADLKLVRRWGRWKPRSSPPEKGHA
jgi:hypothetical protein